MQRRTTCGSSELGYVDLHRQGRGILDSSSILLLHYPLVATPHWAQSYYFGPRFEGFPPASLNKPTMKGRKFHG
jgi:hypothetical protein